jgi:methyltransferase (TIGR00027 family)
MITKNQKSVKSAQTVSFLRAVADIESDTAVRSGDYMAKDLLDKKYKWLLQTMPHRFLKALIHLSAPGTYCSMIIRTKHFDATLSTEIEKGIKQVVILGAGYDTRSYRFMDQLKNINVFEVDLPVTQFGKRSRLMQTCKFVPDNLRFIPVDFNKELWEKALIKNGFSLYLKTLFLWEGVTYYLPETTVQQVFQFVNSCAPGSSILFDYALKTFVNGDQSTYGGKQFAKWLKKINEPFLFGLNPSETSEFLSKNNLSLVTDLGPDEFEKKYLFTSKGTLLGKTVGHFRIAHARVS